MEQRVEQHRAVAGRQHEAVAVRPIGSGGVELQEAGEQHGGDVGHAHRHAGMAGFGLLHRVHGERPDGIGHVLVRHGTVLAHFHRRICHARPAAAVAGCAGSISGPRRRRPPAGVCFTSAATGAARRSEPAACKRRRGCVRAVPAARERCSEQGRPSNRCGRSSDCGCGPSAIIVNAVLPAASGPITRRQGLRHPAVVQFLLERVRPDAGRGGNRRGHDRHPLGICSYGSGRFVQRGRRARLTEPLARCIRSATNPHSGRAASRATHWQSPPSPASRGCGAGGRRSASTWCSIDVPVLRRQAVRARRSTASAQPDTSPSGARAQRRLGTVARPCADRQLLGRCSRASSTRDWIACRVSSASDLPSLVICSSSDW